jgi:hypothetical protein
MFDDLLDHVLHQATLSQQLLRVFSVREVLFYQLAKGICELLFGTISRHYSWRHGQAPF